MLAIIVVQKEMDLKEYPQISWQMVKYPVITEKIQGMINIGPAKG